MPTQTRRGLLNSAVATAAVGAAAGAAWPGLAAGGPAPSGPSPRERISLDADWRFHLGHAQDPARDFGFGADQALYAKSGPAIFSPTIATFDDSLWARINVPHDWATDLPFAPPTGAVGLVSDDPRAGHGYKPLGREFPDTSIGWYRRRFALAASDAGKRISLEFDGVFRDCLVSVNGYVLAQNRSGYAPFRVDITDIANCGGINVVAVRVDASEGEGWFYEGAGIYRHVWLVKTAPLHVPQWGAFVRSKVEGAGATLTLTTEIANEGDAARTVNVVSTIVDPDGKPVGEARGGLTLAPWTNGSVDQTVALARASLWSVETPRLYTLHTRIEAEGGLADTYETPFGVRSIRFDPQTGFFLNDRPVKLKGTCNHQDHAGVGVAVPDRLHAFRVEQMKAMGSNAWRTAHNPPASALLDACDRLGMLVIDETRRMSVDPEAIDQLERMVRRDRNHPSIILWSIGNEEAHESEARGARIAADMKRAINRLDGTRLITEAMDNGWGAGVTSVIDVVGFNYRVTKIDDFHAKFPQIPVIGTETGSTVTTRGVYARDNFRQFVPAYDVEAPWWASTAEAWWPYVADRDYIAGGFVWTGFDYRGEPTPFNHWPSVSSNFGLLDICGFPKDEFYYYKACWTDAPMAHLLPHWTWPGLEGKAIDVWCYANVDRVELVLNGKSLGAKPVARNGHLAWSVPYAPGVLEARGFRGDKLVVTDRRETAGAPTRIALTADRSRLAADGADLAVVRAEIVDVRGRPVPTAANVITLAVSGPGALIGMGNGDPTNHTPDHTDTIAAFNSLCMGLVQTRGAGRIRVTATSPELKGAEVGLASG